MSLLNAWATPERVVLATDTASQYGERRLHTSKMAALPHLGAVVATIGNCDLYQAFTYTVGGLDCSFDRFLANARELIEESVALFEARASGPAFPSQAVAVAGWSEARDQAVGVYWQRLGVDEATFVQLRGSLFCPGWPGYRPHDPDTDAKLLAAARAQVEHGESIRPGCPIGGNLTIAEVSRKGLSFRSMRIGESDR